MERERAFLARFRSEQSGGDDEHCNKAEQTSNGRADNGEWRYDSKWESKWVMVDHLNVVPSKAVEWQENHRTCEQREKSNNQ